MTGNAPPDRYHLLLTLDGAPTMHGWWASDPVARAKARQTIGEYSQPGARVTLTDELTGERLTEWSAPA